MIPPVDAIESKINTEREKERKKEWLHNIKETNEEEDDSSGIKSWLSSPPHEFII